MARSTKNSTEKIRIILKSFDHTIINKASSKIIESIERSGAIMSGPIPLPTKRKIFTFNRSTFVSNSSKQQFQVLTHKRLIDINESTSQTIETLKNLSLPSGVDIEIKMIAS